MKREILFKGKRVDNGEWVEGFLLKDRVLGCYITEGLGASGIEVHPETVCQFTGLIDKKKNKIFEDDIVQTSENPLNTTTVVWNNRTKGFVLDTPNYKNQFTRITGLGKLLLRGNIHD